MFAAVGTVVMLALLRQGDARRSAWRPTGPHLFAGALRGRERRIRLCLDRTDAASVLVIIAAGPLIASVLGGLFLHEPAHVRTWLTALRSWRG
jgi:drug/metabolite transporter (DMT)-like permease